MSPVAVAPLKLVEAAGPRHPLRPLAELVRPHLPTFAKRAADTEKARMVSPESIDLLREVGFFRAFVPAAYGGDERGLHDFVNGIRTIASVCPSTAWVTGVLSVHPLGIAHFTKQVQDEFWATGPDTIASSSGAPILKGVRVEGGVRVTGRGRWSSGCDHGSWVQIGLKVPDSSNRQYPEWRFSDYFAMVPRADYTIDDTWYSNGLSGTGSKDVVLNDVFIPNYRIERQESFMTLTSKGEGQHPGCYHTRIPFPVAFAIFLPAVALGCADGMIAEFVKRQKLRKNSYSGGQYILSTPGYMRLAESVHDLEAVTAFFDNHLTRIEQFGRNAERMSEKSFMELQSKLPYPVRRAVSLIDRLFEASGASAIASFNPMQRFWRDAHTAALHQGMDYDLQLQMYGRHLMGLGFDPNL